LLVAYIIRTRQLCQYRWGMCEKAGGQQYHQIRTVVISQRDTERERDRQTKREREVFYLTRLSTASYKMLVVDGLKYGGAALVQ